jgi:hypothetical protein
MSPSGTTRTSCYGRTLIAIGGIVETGFALGLGGYPCGWVTQTRITYLLISNYACEPREVCRRLNKASTEIGPGPPRQRARRPAR